MKIEVEQLLQSVGLLVLYVFFFSYGAGASVGIGQYYLVFIYAAIIISIIILMRNTKCLYRYKGYFIWMGLFILFQAISLIYTIDISKGLSWLFSSIKIIIKITAVVIICKDFQGLIRFFRGIAYVGGLYFITLLMTGHLYEGWRLGTELLGNANSFAMIVTFYSLGAMVSFFNEKNIFKKFIFVILFILDVYMIFLSGGRKFLLFQVVFIYSSFMFRESHVKIKNIAIGAIITVLVVYAGYYIIMNNPVLYRSIGVRFVGFQSAEGAIGVNDQLALMRRGLEMFIQRPILGWGISGFQQYHGVYYGKSFYAHSNYIELLADYGVIGTVLYLSQYYRCLIHLLKNRSTNSPERKLFLPLLLSIIVLDVFAVTFNQTAFVPLLIMLISGTLSYNANNEVGNHLELETERII